MNHDEVECAYCGHTRTGCDGKTMLLKSGERISSRHFFTPWHRAGSCECRVTDWHPWQRVAVRNTPAGYSDICISFVPEVDRSPRTENDICLWCGHKLLCHVTVEEVKINEWDNVTTERC